MKAPHTRTAMPRITRIVGSCVVGVLATIAVAWVVAIDLLVVAAWLHPVGWVIALAPVTILALVSLTPPYRTNPKPKWVYLCAFFFSTLVILVPWNRRKRFVHDVFSVRSGMLVDEAEAVMAGYIKGAGAKWQIPQEPPPRVRGPEDPEEAAAARRARAAPDECRKSEILDGEVRRHFTGTITYRWDTANYDADWGLVEFVDGRVLKVEFLPD